MIGSRKYTEGKVPVWKFGARVRHKRFGIGIVRNEWGPIMEDEGDHESMGVGLGIYDVIFTRESGDRFLHSCRYTYLRAAPEQKK